MAVYLLKYEDYAGDPDRPRASARYYIGYCEDEHLPRRIRMHRTGHWTGEGGGSEPKLTRWFREQGIGFRVVRVFWGADRRDERRLKQGGHYDRLDPFVARRLWRPPWLRRRDDAQHEHDRQAA